MAKRKRRRSTRSCLVDGCNQVAVQGAKACRDHFNPIALQAEIERLRNGQLLGVEARQILRYAEVRLLLGTLSSLDRGTGSKSANGKLGAAVSMVARAAEEVERIAGPGSGPPRPRGKTHCGRDRGPDASYCGDCGEPLSYRGRMRASERL